MIFLIGDLEHARVHPKFLHSNATSHKWAFGGTFICYSYSVEGKQYYRLCNRTTGLVPFTVYILTKNIFSYSHGKYDKKCSTIVEFELSDG